MLGSDEMAADVATKLRLREATGAMAVDMESHIVAEAAARHGLPFAVARAISDASDRALPRAAQAGMAPDGRMDVMAVLKALAARPWELPALIRTGIEAEAGFRALEAFPAELLRSPVEGLCVLRHAALARAAQDDALSE